MNLDRMPNRNFRGRQQRLPYLVEFSWTLQGDSVPRALGLSLVASNVFSAFDNNKFDFSAKISSRMFETIAQNGPEYSHRNLAIARFLVTAVRKNIGGLLSWLVSFSSSVPELTRHGLGGSLHVNPQWGRVLKKEESANESIPLKHVPGWGGWRKSGGVI